MNYVTNVSELIYPVGVLTQLTDNQRNKQTEHCPDVTLNTVQKHPNRAPWHSMCLVQWCLWFEEGIYGDILKKLISV